MVNRARGTSLSLVFLGLGLALLLLHCCDALPQEFNHRIVREASPEPGRCPNCSRDCPGKLASGNLPVSKKQKQPESYDLLAAQPPCGCKEKNEEPIVEKPPPPPPCVETKYEPITRVIKPIKPYESQPPQSYNVPPPAYEPHQQQFYVAPPATPCSSQPSQSYSQPPIKPYLPEPIQPYSQPQPKSYESQPTQTYSQPQVKLIESQPVQSYNQPQPRPYESQPLQSYNTPQPKSYESQPLQSYSQPETKSYKSQPLQLYPQPQTKPYEPAPVQSYGPGPLQPYEPQPIQPYSQPSCKSYENQPTSSYNTAPVPIVRPYGPPPLQYGPGPVKPYEPELYKASGPSQSYNNAPSYIPTYGGSGSSSAAYSQPPTPVPIESPKSSEPYPLENTSPKQSGYQQPIPYETPVQAQPLPPFYGSPSPPRQSYSAPSSYQPQPAQQSYSTPEGPAYPVQPQPTYKPCGCLSRRSGGYGSKQRQQQPRFTDFAPIPYTDYGQGQSGGSYPGQTSCGKSHYENEGGYSKYTRRSSDYVPQYAEERIAEQTANAYYPGYVRYADPPQSEMWAAYRSPSQYADDEERIERGRDRVYVVYRGDDNHRHNHEEISERELDSMIQKAVRVAQEQRIQENSLQAHPETAAKLSDESDKVKRSHHEPGWVDVPTTDGDHKEAKAHKDESTVKSTEPLIDPDVLRQLQEMEAIAEQQAVTESTKFDETADHSMPVSSTTTSTTSDTPKSS
ncbi:hypothetical protein QAD02_015626 [Eretmocerus hayati]|uniref:Uncharacterized protein n=1 Tax=Eretmocerus hayati TaxID=131215 RepID=A0ACC2P8A1_9HYME|nr:hypothetical protein QAD02_015626 [Eretmocerus hayati]